jgi:hypothetical protein
MAAATGREALIRREKARQRELRYFAPIPFSLQEEPAIAEFASLLLFFR